MNQFFLQNEKIITKEDIITMCKQGPIKIYLDDIRPIPEGFVGVKSVNDTIVLIELIETEGGKIELFDLDHDLGSYAVDGGDAIKLLDYLVEHEKFYPVIFHTANPVGRANMQRMLDRFWK